MSKIHRMGLVLILILIVGIVAIALSLIYINIIENKNKVPVSSFQINESYDKNMQVAQQGTAGNNSIINEKESQNLIDQQSVSQQINPEVKEIECGTCEFLNKGVCIYYECCSDSDCNDMNPDTKDICMQPSTNNSKCNYMYADKNFISVPENIEISYTEDGKVTIQSDRFVYTTLLEYKEQALLEVGWLEACYEKLHSLLGIKPLNGDKIEFTYDLADSSMFYVISNETGNFIIKQNRELHQFSAYYSQLDATTRACENKDRGARATTHELTHAFSSERIPIHEGLADWGMYKTSDPGYEEIICQETGFVSRVKNPKDFDDVFYKYSKHGDYSDRFLWYKTEYCILKEIESRYGEDAVRKIMVESTHQKYPPRLLRDDVAAKLSLREFLTEIVIPNTDESFKEVLIDKFGFKEEQFVPIT